MNPGKLTARGSAIIDADVHRSSLLRREGHYRAFYEHILQPMSNYLEIERQHVEWANMWGDEILALFDNPVSCLRFAFNLRDLFSSDLEHAGLPGALGVRIALHYGVVYHHWDPVLNVEGVIGHEIVLASRIQESAPVGGVVCTEQLRSLYLAEQLEDFRFDSLGESALSKDSGDVVLYRVLRRSDVGSEAESGPPDGVTMADYRRAVALVQMDSLYAEALDLVETPAGRAKVTKLYTVAMDLSAAARS